MRDAGLPLPQYKIDGFMLCASIFNQAQDEAQDEAQELTETETQILSYCLAEELSAAEIMKQLGHKKLSGNLRKAITALRERAFIVFTLPQTPKSKNQKYKITPAGRQHLTALRKNMQKNGGEH